MNAKIIKKLNKRDIRKLETRWIKEIKKWNETVNFESINIEELIKNGYDLWQVQQVRFGIENNVDIKEYNKIELDGLQMREIRLGLEKGLDISIYKNKAFYWTQMLVLRLAMEKGINVAPIAKPSISRNNMVAWLNGESKIAIKLKNIKKNICNDFNFKNEIKEYSDKPIIKVTGKNCEEILRKQANRKEVKRELVRN